MDVLKTAALEAEAEAARREDVTSQLQQSERTKLEVRTSVHPLPDILQRTQHHGALSDNEAQTRAKPVLA